MGKKRNGWIWPNDGRRHGTFGAFTDVLTGKGPDVHVGRIDGAWRPRRSRWSRWPEYDPHLFSNDNSLPPARRADRMLKSYNFRTRKYEEWHPRIWSDVRWSADRKDPYPFKVRDAWGRWQRMPPLAPLHPYPIFLD